jgi:uncharacterized membrane protein
LPIKNSREDDVKGTGKAETGRNDGSTERRFRAAVLAVLLVAGFAAAASAGILGVLFKESAADRAKSAGVVETAEGVRIPLAALDSGKVLFLSLKADGPELHYFALKSTDGAYRAALDACDVCFRATKGYRQDGDTVVCRNCNQPFPCNKIGETKGGCNPHGLPHRIDGKFLVILKADILAGKRYFPRERS